MHASYISLEIPWNVLSLQLHFTDIFHADYKSILNAG